MGADSSGEAGARAVTSQILVLKPLLSMVSNLPAPLPSSSASQEKEVCTEAAERELSPDGMRCGGALNESGMKLFLIYVAADKPLVKPVQNVNQIKAESEP